MTAWRRGYFLVRRRHEQKSSGCSGSFCLRLWKIIVEWVAVVTRFRMNDRSDDGTDSFKVKIKTNTAKFTNMIIAGFWESRYLVRESKVFLKDNTKLASRVRQWVVTSKLHNAQMGFTKGVFLTWFLPLCMECRCGPAMRILYVCLSDKRVNCDKTEERFVQIFTPYERPFSLAFWEEE